MKKYLIISIIIILLTGLGYVFSLPCENFPQTNILKYLYNLKCKSVPQKSLPTIPETSNNQSQIPENNLENKPSNLALKIKKLSDKKILSFIPNQKGEIIAVDEIGEIIKINNQEEIINNSITTPPQSVSFSPDGSKIAFVFNNFSSIFDIETNAWTQLPESSYEAIINSKNIVAFFKKEGDFNSIYQLDLNKKNATPVKIIQTSILDPKLIWKDENNLLITSRPSSLNTNYVWNLNIKDKTLKPIYELPGLYFNWDEKNNNGTLFYTSGELNLNKGGSFSLINNELKQQRVSFLTLPSKCTFNTVLIKNQNNKQTTSNVLNLTSTTEFITTSTETVLICAIPRNQEDLKNKLIIDDYLTYKLYTIDDVYKIHTQTGLIENLFTDKNQYFDVDQIKILNNKIFFINRFDQNLYSIDL